MTRQRDPTVLLTGFAPFGGELVNPSWQAVRALDGAMIEDHRVVAVELPTEFDASLPTLWHALREHEPRVAIAVGLAGGREGLSLERVAINLIDARIPDNAGAQPVDVPVLRGGAAAFFSTLPIKAALLELQRAGIPARISQTAGTYVCNQVFYALMHALRRQRNTRAGFVHVPWSPQQAAAHAQPGMPIEDVQRALEIIVRTALTTRADARIAAGREA
ncbi:MAG: Pyrrolidone-carboxylate peptidase [Rhodanobacteraceae bacterium]|nr:MAG: Pyrrolidone-carboxylate peptidase [Rhodanobacteraceae bacterium]